MRENFNRGVLESLRQECKDGCLTLVSVNLEMQCRDFESVLINSKISTPHVLGFFVFKQRSDTRCHENMSLAV